MIRQRITVSLAAAAAIAASGGGTAYAAPAAPPPIHVDVAPGVDYTGSVVDNSAVVHTPLGSLTTRGGDFQLLDSGGRLIAGTPLTPSQQRAEWPEAARAVPSTVSSKGGFGQPGAVTAADAPTPTPNSAAGGVPGLRNVDASADFNGALAVAATQFGLATGVGTLAGGLVGLGVGCVGGALTGGFAGLPTGPIAAPAALFGCIIGGSVGAGIGGIAGAALLGIPVGVASAVQMYNSLHAAGDI